MGSPENISFSSVALEDEILMLNSIYPGEFEFEVESLTHDSKAVFRINISPATGGDVSQQNIFVVLELVIPSGYPDVLPSIRLQKPRGLSDLQLMSICHQLSEEAAKRRGSAMIYDLIDLIRDFLTQSNFPNVECPFCLCFIEDGESFYRTECFHYYHTFCLRNYLEYLERNRSTGKSGLQSCIVCRTEFETTVRLADVEKGDEPAGMKFTPVKIILSEDILQEQARREKLFEGQKQKRGIILPDPRDEVILTLSHIPEIENQILFQSTADS